MNWLQCFFHWQVWYSVRWSSCSIRIFIFLITRISLEGNGAGHFNHAINTCPVSRHDTVLLRFTITAASPVPYCVLTRIFGGLFVFLSPNTPLLIKKKIKPKKLLVGIVGVFDWLNWIEKETVIDHEAQHTISSSSLLLMSFFLLSKILTAQS